MKREVNLGTFVDEEEGDIDDESGVELDGNNQLDLDVDQEHNDDNLESDLLSDSEDRTGAELAQRKNFNSPRTGLKLENTNLLVVVDSSSPV